MAIYGKLHLATSHAAEVTQATAPKNERRVPYTTRKLFAFAESINIFSRCGRRLSLVVLLILDKPQMIRDVRR